MATLPDMQGRGAGRALVAEGDRVAAAAGAALMWCNARVTARGFYERLGYVAVGDAFELPASGRHFVMIKDLSGPS
jgi:ribosomal protein S18 acetylase RimI-like enzyme